MLIKKDILKTPEMTAVIAAMTTGIIVHLFALTNVLFNHDNINVFYYGYGAGVTSGRWFLQILSNWLTEVGFAYNLPTVNGLLFLMLVSFAGGGTVSVFQIQKRWSAALIGILFVVFPTVTSTLIFRFTAPPYGLAILLAVVAVWVVQRFRFGIILSAICTALSMGIYQAYVPMTISMFVVLLIQDCLSGDKTHNCWYVIKKGLAYCTALLIGVALYLVCSNLALRYWNVTLTDYQGISTMGRISLKELPSLIIKAYRLVLRLGIEDYCGLTSMPVMRLCYTVSTVLSVCVSAHILIRKVRRWSMALLVSALYMVLPLAVNFVYVMASDGWMYTMMVYSFVMLPCLPLILLEQLPEAKQGWESAINCTMTKAIGTVLALLIVVYGYYDNVNYTTLYYSTVQMENYVNAMVTQVRMTEGFTTDKRWALIGSIQDPLHSLPWESGYTYGGNNITRVMLIDTPYFWIKNLLGYRVTEASKEEIAQISQTEEVQQMPYWPNNGSIKIIGDLIVIKCPELVF